MSVTYDTEKASIAIRRFSSAPESLTDEDVALLELIDPGLGKRAGVRRVSPEKDNGDEPDYSEKELAATRKPATIRNVFNAFRIFRRNYLAPVLATYRYRIRDAYGKIEALEARIAALEARPLLKYMGVWSEGDVYPEGRLATHKGGLWLSTRVNSERPGSDGGAWRLIVKRGDA